MDKNNLKILYAFIGLLLGGFIGFLLRPSSLIVGKLPIGDIISRGNNFTGADKLFIPLAEKSFNILIACTISGILLGLFIYSRSINTAKGESCQVDDYSCGKCNSSIKENENYCPKCGDKIEWD